MKIQFSPTAAALSIVLRHRHKTRNETYVPSMRSLARSATAIVAALITACGIPGITEASTTRKSATPFT